MGWRANAWQSVAVDEVEGGGMPLHIAAENGDVIMAVVLVAAGAVVNRLSSSGFAPLRIACQNGHAEVAMLLVLTGVRSLLFNVHP